MDTSGTYPLYYWRTEYTVCWTLCVGYTETYTYGEIWCSQSCDCEDKPILWCVHRCWRGTCFHHSWWIHVPWCWKQRVPLKCQYIFPRLYGVTSQKPFVTQGHVSTCIVFRIITERDVQSHIWYWEVRTL